jgi:hypothetical protein
MDSLGFVPFLYPTPVKTSLELGTTALLEENAATKGTKLLQFLLSVIIPEKPFVYFFSGENA